MNVPKPYQGKEKFIFISYSHRDTAKVFPIISALMENGYRVWYDQGIDPGTEWDENIATHIDTCGYFIAFMSTNYLGSNNCKDELNYARDLEKDRLIVYLEEVTLPAGMAMRVNRLQSIFKYTYVNEADFYEKLFAANNINVCLHEKTQTKQDATAQAECEPAAPAAPVSVPVSAPAPGYHPQGGYAPQNVVVANQNNGAVQNPYSDISYANQNSRPTKSKIIAGLLALFLGGLGVHKFYLGKHLQGVLYFLFNWTFIPGFLALIDAIILFTTSDANFMKKYNCRIG